jgi:hypothetical protein
MIIQDFINQSIVLLRQAISSNLIEMELYVFVYLSEYKKTMGKCFEMIDYHASPGTIYEVQKPLGDVRCCKYKNSPV